MSIWRVVAVFAVKNRILAHALTFFAVVVSAVILSYALSALTIFTVLHHKADAKKAPLQHKYSIWLGNGQALRKHLPELLAQAKGLNSRNIKPYLIIDKNIKTFLATSAPTPEEIAAINAKFHGYDLQPPERANSYAEYFEQVGLIAVNDSDVFNTLERELTEHYVPEFRKMYNEHLHVGHQNGKDYSFASDVLRVAAIQHIGKAGEVIMYTDADIAVDYRRIKELVPVKRRHPDLVVAAALRHASHRAFKAAQVRRAFKKNFGPINDVFVATAKMSTLSFLIEYMAVWHDIEKNTPVYSFSLCRPQESCEQGGGYGLKELTLRNFSFDLGDKADEGAFNFVRKNDLENFWPFFYVPSPRFFTLDAHKLKKEINKLRANNPRFYALIAPFMSSGDYVLFSSSLLFWRGLFAGTTGGLLAGVNKETRLLSSLGRDHWLTYGMRTSIIKAITIDPEDFGITHRHADVSWAKGNKYGGIPGIEGPLSTIYTTSEFDEWMRASK